MISTKRTFKTERNKLRNDILDELDSLKKNNRDLARSLAEKSKENTNLREIENKYHILETKFKMNQEQRQSSISNLEIHFTQTCSLLSNVVKNLSVLHDTLREDKKVLCSSSEINETEKKTALGDEETSLLKETHSLRHVDYLLRRLSTSYIPVSLGITVNPSDRDNEELTFAEKEVCNGRHRTIARNKSVPEEAEMGIIHLHNGGHRNEEKSFMNSKNSNRSHSRNNSFRNIIANNNNRENQTLCPIVKNESSFDTTTSSVFSYPIKSGDSSLLLNEDYRPLEEKQSMLSAGNETFHFSQDEAFQNISADDETITRKGADVFLFLGRDNSHSTHQMNIAKSALSSQIQGDRIYFDECIENKQENTQSKINNTIQLNFSKHFVDVFPVTRINYIEQVNCNELILNRNSSKKCHVATGNCEISQVPQDTVSDPEMGLESVTSVFIDKSNVFSPGESDSFNYSRSLIKTESNQTLHNPRNVYNKSIRKPDDHKLRILSSDVQFPNYTPELYPLLRHNCMLTLNLETNSAQLVEDESYHGKENHSNAVPKRELRQTEARKSRKPFQNKQEEICSNNHNEIKSFETENVYGRLQKHGLNETNLLKLPEKLRSQKNEASEKSRFSKQKSSTKIQKAPCVKKKNLRL